MKPIYGLHKNADGEILSAQSCSYSFELEKWLRALDIQPGDTITFGEVLVRKNAEPLAVAA